MELSLAGARHPLQRWEVVMLEQNRKLYSAVMASYLALSCLTGAYAFKLHKHELTDKEAAKSSNVAEAEKLNGETPKADKKADDQPKSASSEKAAEQPAKPADKKTAKDTANAVNNVPGVNVSQKDLEPPASPPIKGFHPIKKLLRPIENLEGMSIKLEQQIMKLEGPIAGLQPPMKALQVKMTGVDDRISKMQDQLNGMQQQVTGVRSDLEAMRKQISQLQSPIEALRKPISNVSHPLEQVQQQLNFVLLAIVAAAIGIAVGTPIAAFLIYRNRHKLFPDLKEKDLPELKAKPARARR